MENTLENYNPLFEMYQSLFKYNPDPTYAITPDRKFILCNDETTKFLGYEKKEIIGMPFDKLIDFSSLEETFFYFDDALKGKTHTFNSIIIKKTGEKRIAEIKIVPFYSGDLVKGIIGIAKDVTEKKALEVFLEGQNNILEMITKNNSFQDVLDNIALLFEKISVRNGKCSIMLMNDNSTHLEVGSIPSLPREYVKTIKKTKIPVGMGTCGTSALLKEIVITENTKIDPLWKDVQDYASSFHLAACWSFPFYDENDEVLGTFSIYYDKPHAPDSHDIEILKKASYLCGIAIEHYKSKEKINRLAFEDPLTGLSNRRYFDEILRKTLLLSLESKKHFSVVFIDLDRFKIINDTYGHEIGDSFLIEVSKRLACSLRKNDVIARQGGDEFIVLLNDSSVEIAREIGGRIVDILEKPFLINGIEIFITPSVGISVFPEHGATIEELIKKADAAMYEAKKEGGNAFKLHKISLNTEKDGRLNLENHLRRALEKEEMSLQYQPKLDLLSGKIIGVEALLRWNNPVFGHVSPEKFIPIAEETGLIIPIGEWVIRTACLQLKKWSEEGLSDLTVAVNLSLRQFVKPDIAFSIENILKETGLNPSLLDLEITESMTMDVNKATDILNELKMLGVKISIDDFGTGYSSFNYVKHFPVDYVKIDKSFINDITYSSKSENIVNIIFLMAKVGGFKVVAEGVETIDQLELLEKLNCDEVQGYYFSKPLPSTEVKKFIENFHKERIN